MYMHITYTDIRKVFCILYGPLYGIADRTGAPGWHVAPVTRHLYSVHALLSFCAQCVIPSGIIVDQYCSENLTTITIFTS